jgi:cobalamin biosynthesis Mg chelatase CobN
VAERAKVSGSLALSRRPRDAARTLPRAAVGASTFSTARKFPPGPAQPAEIAQARVFERLLRAECAELQELAHRMTADKSRHRGPDDSSPSGELTEIRARIDEIDALLRALQGRFPQPVPDGDRSPA